MSGEDSEGRGEPVREARQIQMAYFKGNTPDSLPRLVGYEIVIGLEPFYVKVNLHKPIEGFITIVHFSHLLI